MLRGVGSLATVGELLTHDRVEEVVLDLGREDGGVEIDSTGAPLTTGTQITDAGGTGNFYPRLTAHATRPEWMAVTAGSFKRALDTAKEFERLNVFSLEEPLPKYDFERLAELNRLTPINLAGGEAQAPGIHEFRWLLEKGCFDIIQPEIDTQGPAVLQKVAVIAESMEKMICPHLGDGRLSTVCDMHLVATWPNAPMLEVGNEGPEGAYEHSLRGVR